MDRGNDTALKNHISESTKMMVCSECKTKGHLTKNGKDYYRDSNLLPVWYERNVDGSKLDAEGKNYWGMTFHKN
jgi:hypothetical protein